MSSSETDSEVSCPSDDSNYNFIPPHMIEDAEIQVLSILSQSHAWVLAQLTKSMHIFVSS